MKWPRHGHPDSLQTYIEKVTSLGNGDFEQFMQVKQPVFIEANAYLNRAKAYDQEKNTFTVTTDPAVKITIDPDGTTWLELTADAGIFEMMTKIYATQDLEMPRITEAPFENPDDTPIIWDTDYFDQKRAPHPVSGPIESLKKGYNKIKVW